MDLCSDNHEEVCYEGRNCPVCEMRDEMQADINEQAKKIDSLNDEIESMYEQE